MKRSLVAAVVAAACIVLVSGLAYAQEKGDGQKQGQRGGHGGPGGPGGHGNWPTPDQMLEQMKANLNLTPEQVTQIQKMVDDQKAAVAAWEKENGEKMRELREKARGEDKEVAKSAGDEMRTLMQSRMQLGREFMTKIESVLTEEQRAKARELLQQRMGGRFDVIHAIKTSLKLTDDQKAKVEEILKGARGEDGKPNPEAMKAAIEKIKSDVLTEDQRKQLAEMEKQAMRNHEGPGLQEQLKNLKLTEDQQKQVDSILAEARKKAEGAEGDARREIMREAGKKIITEVLTEEQRKEFRQSFGGPGEGRRHHEAGGKGGSSSAPAGGENS